MKFQSTVFLNPGERGRSSPRFGRTPQRTREQDAMCCPRRPMKGPRQIPPKRASPLPLCVFELSFRLLIDLLVTCPEGKAAALGWELSQGCNHPSVLGVATGGNGFSSYLFVESLPAVNFAVGIATDFGDRICSFASLSGIVVTSMSVLSKLRCITVDVTGTLIAYKGELGDYYCMAAKAVGLPCPDYKRMHEGFKDAYTDMAKRYPCFGHAAKMPNIDWWRSCVKDSFIRAGYHYDDETFEKVFRRIYASFGSSAPYSIFPDSQPFLRWARDKGLIVGIVSNAEYRYQDVILPALGLNKGSEWDFGVFSGVEGVEKPNPRIYEIALEKAGNVAPNEALHIGDSMRKDYHPATSIGMHALLLDRFKTPDAESWRKSGAPVLPDLVAVQAWLTQEEEVAAGR